MTKLVIIDDEENTRETLSRMVKQKCNDIEVVGFGEDVKSGIAAIEEHKPDIILLDIKMPDGTGFDLLSRISDEIYTFQVIFITAYEEYALKAFKFSAIDYLLKPVAPSDLENAIEKCRKMFKNESREKTDIHIYNEEKQRKDKKIVLKTHDSMHVVNIKDIIRCEGEAGYTTFYISGKEPLVITESIKDFEEFLEELGFLRVHQTHLINLSYVQKFDKRDGGYVIMSDNSMIPVSRRKKDIFLNAINEL